MINVCSNPIIKYCWPFLSTNSSFWSMIIIFELLMFLSIVCFSSPSRLATCKLLVIQMNFLKYELECSLIVAVLSMKWTFHFVCFWFQICDLRHECKTRFWFLRGDDEIKYFLGLVCWQPDIICSIEWIPYCANLHMDSHVFAFFM